MKRLAITVLSLLSTGFAFATETQPFVTGFETTDTPAYTTGNLDGQGTAGSWTVLGGSVNVQTSVVSRGEQAVHANSGSAEVATSVSNNVVWTDFFIRTSGSANAPAIPADSYSAVLFFDDTGQLQALDGDGSGGGSFTVITNLPGMQFSRVSIRKDFAAKTYDVWVGGVEAATGYGFKNNDREQVNAVQIVSEDVSYVDDLSVTHEGIDVDTDTDFLVDLDELKFHGTLPTNPDTDGDRMIDGDEVFAMTDPTDENSFLALNVDSVSSSQITVSVQTENGLLYTIQQSTGIVENAWADDPNHTAVPGDGTEQTYPVDFADPASHGIRVSVTD